MCRYARLAYPALAAGLLATPRGVLQFVRHVCVARVRVGGSSALSHYAAVRMLHPRGSVRLCVRSFVRSLTRFDSVPGGLEFMGAEVSYLASGACAVCTSTSVHSVQVGLGIFIAECGANRIAIHQVIRRCCCRNFLRRSIL